MKVQGLLLLMVFHLQSGYCQSIGSELPENIDSKGRYLFYFHGAVVSVLGDNAINTGAPEWGPYEYSKILDSLRARGYHVISEIRDKDLHDSVFVNKAARQVSALRSAGVKPRQLVLVGASSGWGIVLGVSDKLQDKRMKYVMMGGCWPETWKNYESLRLKGHFLSIIERSDPHKTCGRIFSNRNTVSSFREIELNTGLSHGFFYRGWRHWIDPVVDWELKSR